MVLGCITTNIQRQCAYLSTVKDATDAYFAQFCITQCWRYSPANSWSQWGSGDHSWLWKILASFSPAADSYEGEMVLLRNLFELLHSTCRDHLFSSLLWQLEQHCTSWKLLPTQCYWEREGYSYGSKCTPHITLNSYTGNTHTSIALFHNWITHFAHLFLFCVVLNSSWI